MTASLKTDNLNILIIRLSSIGDIFHAFTTLSDIRNTYPNASIDWLVDEDFIEIAKLSPLIDNLHSIPIKKWKKESKFKAIIQLKKWTRDFKIKYNNKKYDYVIDMHGLIKTAILTKCFNGPSYGLNYKSAKEKLWASAFYDHTYYVNRNQVAIKRFRSLVGQILHLNYKASFQFVINIKTPMFNITGPYIMLLHGTSKEIKKWSLQNWAELSIDLLTSTSYKIAITYSNNSEHEFIKNLAAILHEAKTTKPDIMLENFIVIPSSPINELCSIINNASLIIGVDTGFTHLANLLHKPVIGIYKITNQNYGGLFPDTISFNVVCDNSKGEHKFIQGVIKAHKLI
jgi:heptosyltransferase-1